MYFTFKPQPAAMQDGHRPSPWHFFPFLSVQSYTGNLSLWLSPRMNKSKHQNEVQLCLTMPWSRTSRKALYVGLTDVTQLSPYKLLCTTFLALLVFLVLRILALSQSYGQCTYYSTTPLLFSNCWAFCRSIAHRSQHR